MASATNPAGELAGAVLNGRWRLLRLLGEGGMGAVYEAEGVRGEGRRAIKLLHPEFVKEPVVVQRFYTEAQAARALAHPNVAQVQDAGTAEDGTPYLVMELLQGTPLTTWLERGTTVPPQQTAQIGLAVLQALVTAHTARIVHRDLKPDNLFLVQAPSAPAAWGPAPHVKVLDFGIAKVMDAAGGMGHKTRTGVLLGTPGYMSPEQIQNSKAVDPRSDLWSLGIILYEMLTGKPPFAADNEFARLTAVLTEPVKPIEQVAPHLAAWAPFFRRALAKELSERFQSAEEMARALAPYAQGGAAALPGPAGHPGSVVHAGAAAQAPVDPGAASYAAHASALPATAAPQTFTAGPSYAAPSAVHGVGARGTIMTSPSPQPSAQAAAPIPPAGHAPAVPVVTAVSAQRPPGVPTLRGAEPSIEIVQAPPRHGGAPWWVVGVVAFVCIGLGFAAGYLAGGG